MKLELDKAETNTGSRLRLTDLIIYPFQRLTKYPELFKGLLKNTDRTRIDVRKHIEFTIKQMEDICFHSNQTKCDQESLEKIDALVKSLNGSLSDIDFKSLGRFIKDEFVISATGPLIQDNNKKLLLLFEKELIVCNKTTNNKYTYIDSFPVDNELKVLSNRHFNKNEFYLSVSNYTLHKQYCFYFRIEKVMNAWTEQINRACSVFSSSLSNHKLVLSNFNSLTECNVCEKIHNGIFYQGYKCELCLQVAHKSCISKLGECKIKINIYYTKPEVNETFELTLFKVKTKQTVNKNSNLTLELNVDDLVYSSARVMDDIYKGYKLMFKCSLNPIPDVYKEEGFFSLANVYKVEKNTQLSLQPWYIECDKFYAVKILEQIGTEASSVFLVRFKEKHVFTIKLNSKEIKHIVIHVTNVGMFRYDAAKKHYKLDELCSSMELNNDFYYTIDKYIYFKTIVDLVEYFSQNSLQEFFTDIKKLERPYRDALPIPKYVSVATSDYQGKN